MTGGDRDGRAPDPHFRPVLLGLRRFLAEPRDGPRVVGVVRRRQAVTRVFIEPVGGFPARLAVDFARPPELVAAIAVLRDIATRPYLPRVLPAAPADEFANHAVDATGYLAQLGDDPTSTLDDCADAVIGEVLGDPTWTGPATALAGPGAGGPGSGGPGAGDEALAGDGLASRGLDGHGPDGVVGYVRTAADRIRLYLHRGDLTLGVDVSLADTDGRPPPIRPRLREAVPPAAVLASRAAAGTLDPGDSYCDHLLDLTDRVH